MAEIRQFDDKKVAAHVSHGLRARRAEPAAISRAFCTDSCTSGHIETGEASGLGLFSDAPGVHRSRIECAGPVAWLPAHRVGIRAPLHGCL